MMANIQGYIKMPRLAYKLAIILFLILAPTVLVAQEIKDISYKFVDDKVEVTYNLTGRQNDRFIVNLYYSVNDFSKPLMLVTGEVGENIRTGDNKRVIWDAKTELGDYKGDMSLKLKARIIPFLTFQIANGSEYKRAKDQLISWTPGANETNIKLSLYQDNRRISTIGVSGERAEYNWAIPKNVKPGSNYRIRGSVDDRFAMSEPFTIKRKVPFFLWAAPLAVIGGTVALLVSSNNPAGNKRIPDPAGPN